MCARQVPTPIPTRRTFETRSSPTNVAVDWEERSFGTSAGTIAPGATPNQVLCGPQESNCSHLVSQVSGWVTCVCGV